MSPASSGTLEVERYIGACLISQNRSKNLANNNNNNNNKNFARSRDHQHYVPDLYQQQHQQQHQVNFRLQRCQSADGWVGGMPLVSFANNTTNNNQRRGRRHDVSDGGGRAEHHPLARLAVHTQGAPLILAKSYNHRKNKVHRNASSKIFETSNNNNNNNAKKDTNSAGVDAVSVTSDESSGSANSENCLPRIIKPRKRRKKDRKPTPLLGRPLASGQDGFSTDSASPDIDNTVFDDAYASYRDSPRLIDRRHILGDICETPKLHHSFDDIEELDDGKDVNGNQPASTCQCRYCDPSGQIWDVDRNCYSPFLTPPNSGHHAKTMFQFPNLNLSYTSPISSSESHCLVRGMSTVSLEEEEKKTPPPPQSTTTSCRDLEVSTEIVTSLNGHRDIEIKFFSSPIVEIGAKDSKDKCAVNNECSFVSEE